MDLIWKKKKNKYDLQRDLESIKFLTLNWNTVYYLISVHYESILKDFSRRELHAELVKLLVWIVRDQLKIILPL